MLWPVEWSRGMGFPQAAGVRLGMWSSELARPSSTSVISA